MRPAPFAPLAAALAALALLAAPCARAEDAAGGASGDGDICADRPTKAYGACAVPLGRVQVEAGLVDASFLREGGVVTDTTILAEPTLKYGLLPGLDVEADLPLYEDARTHDRVAGGVSHARGIGDLTLAAKYALPLGEGPVTAALRPFVLLPTARDALGAGGVEGGVDVPTAFKLDADWTLYLNPEADVRRDEAGGGVHAETVQILGLTRQLPVGVSVSGELWGDWSFEGGGRLAQASADLAAAWVIGHDLQLDGGVNLGLNRSTPGAEVYAGVSRRW